MPEEQEMYQMVFQGCSPVEFMNLLRIGQWREAGAESILLNEGQKVKEILFLYNGLAGVTHGGKILNYLKDGAIIGETEYTQDKPAGATIKITTPIRLMVWPTAEIKKLSNREPEYTRVIFSS